MSDVLFRDRKIRKLKRESVTAQKIPLKNKDIRYRKRGIKNGKR